MYLAKTYPTAVKHAAMIYLNVPATMANAEQEVKAYTSVGFNYVYNTSATPTQANYAANVEAMQNLKVQYVTEYSDESSAVRLLQSMEQYNFTPQVVDWFSEEYSPQFIQQTTPASNGDLVLLSATDAYSDASSNSEMQLFLSWMNRVAPGFHQDIFAILAWSAGLAFEAAAKAVGPDLTRPALLIEFKTLPALANWTGDGIQPPVNIGRRSRPSASPISRLRTAPSSGSTRPRPTPSTAAAPSTRTKSGRSVHEFFAFTVIGIVAGATYAVAASGLVVTYSTSGIFNIAHGAIGMFMAFVYWQLSVPWHIPPGWAFVITVFVLAPDLRGPDRAAAHPAGRQRLGHGHPGGHGRADPAPDRPAQKIWGNDSPVVAQFFGHARVQPVRRLHRLRGRHHDRHRHRHRRRVSACCSSRPGSASPCGAWWTTGNWSGLFGGRPSLLSTFSWAIGASLASVAGILAAPILQLNPLHPHPAGHRRLRRRHAGPAQEPAA